MAIASELVAPIDVDLRAEDKTFNIIKGMEKLNTMDLSMDDTSEDIQPGLWVEKTSTGCQLPSSQGLAQVYPVMVGNNQFDSIASGKITVIVGGGFLYETTQVESDSYTVGQLLTVNNATGKLQVASNGDTVVAKIWSYDSTKLVATVEALSSAYILHAL